MAIPEGRMSTTPVPGTYGPPDDRKFYALTNSEKGPLAIEDTTLGLLYQNWTVSYDANTGVLTALPETTQVTETVETILGVLSLTFTFDQAGRISFTYTTITSSYLYWYDTFLGQTVTTDLGITALAPTLLLDDKRNTQNTTNDMLLWYTKQNGSTYDLYMLRQRDRFQNEILMDTGLPYGYIHNIGMHNALRLQLTLKPYLAGLPYVPPAPTDPNNLDFEKGNVNWTLVAGIDWSINQNDPYNGFWNASLISTGAYSSFENDHYFPVTGNQSVTIKMFSKGTIGQGLAFGYATYDSNFAPIGGSQLVINVEADWKEDEWTDTVAANAAYIRVTMQSNGQVGTYYVDNFSVIT